jgi:hypothetical protein
MPWLLVVIVLLAAAAGLYKCSPDQKPRIQKRLETPARVQEEVLQHLDEGTRRYRRALEEQEGK